MHACIHSPELRSTARPPRTPGSNGTTDEGPARTTCHGSISDLSAQSATQHIRRKRTTHMRAQYVPIRNAPYVSVTEADVVPTISARSRETAVERKALSRVAEAFYAPKSEGGGRHSRYRAVSPSNSNLRTSSDTPGCEASWRSCWENHVQHVDCRNAAIVLAPSSLNGCAVFDCDGCLEKRFSEDGGMCMEHEYGLRP